MAKRYLKLAPILKKLLFDREMKSTDLARAIDLPPPTVHRLVTGKSTRPYESSLKPIADFFSIEVEQLLGEKPLSYSNDGNTEQKNSSFHITSQRIHNVPLIIWDKLDKQDKENSIPFLGKISDNGFATFMPDTSMEPLIQRNSILIFDPAVDVTDRGFVLVKLHDSKSFIVRQILLDADHKYLKPLNPDLSSFKMRLLHKHDIITASLIEVRHNFQTQSNQELFKTSTEK